MSWFDGFGLLFVAALLVPNILFAATRPDGFENRYHNPTVERLEQVVRFGCFILMVLRIPVLCHGYWFDGGETVQLAASVVLVTLYLLGWLVFWKEDSVRKSLALRRPVGRGCAGVRCGCLELQKREKGVNSHSAKR